MVYSTRRFVLSPALSYFVGCFFFSPFSIAITSLGEERANLNAFRMFVRFALVWFYLFSLPLRVWDGLLLVIGALPGLFFPPPFFFKKISCNDISSCWIIKHVIFTISCARGVSMNIKI